MSNHNNLPSGPAASTPTLFADSVEQVILTGSLVRIELGTAAFSKQASGAGQQEGSFAVSQQLVMPLEGFVRGFALQQQVMNKLLADGVLRAPGGEGNNKNEAAPATAAAAADAKRSESAKKH